MNLLLIAFRVIQIIDCIKELLLGIERTHGYYKDLRTEIRQVYDELEGFHQLTSRLHQAISPDSPKRSFLFQKPKIEALVDDCNLKVQRLVKGLQKEGSIDWEIPSFIRHAQRQDDLTILGEQAITSMDSLVVPTLIHIMEMIKDRNRNQSVPTSSEDFSWEGARSLQDWLRVHHVEATRLKENMLEVVSRARWLSFQHRESQKPHKKSPLPPWPQAAVAKHLRGPFLESLEYEGMFHRQNCVTAAFTKTFEWIFQNSLTIADKGSPKCEFRQWLRDESGIYWITGKPGSGKSTLMKFIHQDESTRRWLRDWRPGGPLVVAAFYFWNSGTLLQGSTEGMLRSLLYQVVATQSDVMDMTLPTMLDLYALSKDLRTPWTRSELFQAFRLLLEDNGDPLINYAFFLDGLDEFVGDTEVLITFVHQLSSFTNVKICVSSRSWTEFQDSFNHTPKLILHDLTCRDIEHYVRQTFLRHSGFSLTFWDHSPTAVTLIEDISVKSSGVFLWAVLATDLLLEDLGNVDTLPALQLRLEGIPNSLKGLYRNILTSLEPKDLEYTSKLFQIFQASKSRLTVLQLSFADEELENAVPRKVSPLGDEDISHRALRMATLLRSRCKGLLKIEPLHGLHAAQSHRHEPEIDFYNLGRDRRVRSIALSLRPSPNFEARASDIEKGVLLAQHNVGYLDRTLKDFLEDAVSWSLTTSGLDNEFDPYVHLCRAYTLQLKTLDLGSNFSPQNALLDVVSWCLEYASKIRRNDKRLHLYFLDEIDQTTNILASQVKKYSLFYVERYSNSLDSHWLAYISGGLPTDGFLAFAARCHLYDYVRDKLDSDKYGQKDMSRILFTLVTNYRFPRLEHASRIFTPEAPDPRMVRLMLEYGAEFDFTVDGRSTWQHTMYTAAMCDSQEARIWKEILDIFTEFGANESGAIRSLLEQRSREPEVMKFSGPKCTRASNTTGIHLDKRSWASAAVRPSVGHKNNFRSRCTASCAAKDVSGNMKYFPNFIEQLFIELCLYEVSKHEIVRLSKVLPKYLSAFTERLAQNTDTHGQYPIVDVLRKHRDKVAGYVLRIYYGNFEGTEEEEQGVPSDQDERNITEDIKARKKTLDWLRNVSDEFVDPNPAVSDVTQNEKVYLQGSNRPETEDMSMTSTTAFQWLVSDLRRELRLDYYQLNRMRRLSQQILLAAPYEPEEGISPRLYRLSYMIKWELMFFLRDQYSQSGYGESLDLAFERAIVLSGSTIHGQATTCKEYLHQTWPLHADIILEILKSAIKQAEEAVVTTVPGVEGQLLDGTGLRISLDSTSCVVEATGRLVSVAEICEIVAWMSAAFQPSPYKDGIAIFSPYIKQIVLSNDFVTSRKMSCFIGMNYRQAEDKGALPGLCWYSMFKNPVMVEDFPTPVRPAAGTGIQMPLELMARLVGTKKVQEFLGAFFLKGSTSMLYPTESDGRVMSWHHDYNADGKYLSYVDNSTTPLQHISVERLSVAQHIVGWCRTVENLAGSSKFPYGAVKQTFLEEPPSYAVVDRLTVSGGKYITASISMAIGSKDQPTHVPSDDYITRLENQRTGFFVLWDTVDSRGWLLSGNHVILHLVREFLHDKAKDKEWSGSFLCRQDSLQTESLDSPFQILKNDDNRGLRLYTGKHEGKDKYRLGEDDTEGKLSPDDSRTYFIMEQLIEQFLEVLEKVTDYQKKSTAQQGHKLEKEALKLMKARHKSHIQGYDFRDIVKRRSGHPRVEFEIDSTLLGTSGWRDLMTEIHATPLFGRNFGEILQPLPDERSCKHWSILPKGQSYVAMTVDDLSTIIDEYGGETSQNLIRVTKKIYLHTPADPIRTCACVGESYRCDYCQILIPGDKWKFRSNHVKSCGLSPRGAIVLRQAGPLELGEQKVPKDEQEQEESEVDNAESVDIPVVVLQSMVTSSKQSEVEEGSSGQYPSSTATRTTNRFAEVPKASASTSTNDAMGKKSSSAVELQSISLSDDGDLLQSIQASIAGIPIYDPDMDSAETTTTRSQDPSNPHTALEKHSRKSCLSSGASDSLQDHSAQIESIEDTIHNIHTSNTLTTAPETKMPQAGSSAKTKKPKHRSKFLSAFWKRSKRTDG